MLIRKTKRVRKQKSRVRKNLRNRKVSQKGLGAIRRITGNYGHVTENIEKLFRQNSDILKFF